MLTVTTRKKDLLLNLLKPKSFNVILIGPEGDFTKKEIESATYNKFKNISLGDTRLRAETAGIVHAHTFSIVNL